MPTLIDFPPGMPDDQDDGDYHDRRHDAEAMNQRCGDPRRGLGGWISGSSPRTGWGGLRGAGARAVAAIAGTPPSDE